MKKLFILSAFLVFFSGIAVFALNASTKTKGVQVSDGFMFWIDYQECCACGACWYVCPLQAIYAVDGADGPAYYQIDQYICDYVKGCEHVCPVICPTDAIKVL
ncbi:MAG: 4Fe-4S binding protein [Prevotellaceae bacterium]|jgi:MinD superfamily P-loop ATPase|nr:4Fe-4S binding protein [Prevotellaceae bacterium]